MEKGGSGMPGETTLILDEQAVSRAIVRISFEIVERNKGAEDLCIVGIMGGGVSLAKRIAAKISEIEKREVEWGQLDITCHRDDQAPPKDYQDRSVIDFPLTGKRVVLVDDVIYTGRTVRAAIDALMERGRPRNIQLAALIDRGHRELPIRADFIGKNLPTSSGEQVRVTTLERDGVDSVSILK